MLLDELGDCADFRPVEATCLLKHNRVQLEFRNHAFTSHMNMRRFTAIKGYKEETIRTYPQDRRHRYS